MVVLITKGYSKDLRGIGLVEVLWKTTTGIINMQLTTEIQYHDKLNGLQSGCGMGNATLEDNMLQLITTMREAVFHTIFPELQKEYDALEQDRCIYILVGYGVVPRMLRILQTY